MFDSLEAHKRVADDIANAYSEGYEQGKRDAQRWIPCEERLPEPAKDGPSNWHTDGCMVCVYGNACYDGWENFDYEILTGFFIENEDEETGEKELCFQPDRITCFLPDDWDVMPLDKEFKCHLDKDECTYYTDESLATTEFHDRYYQILAWMPLPEPWEGETE